METPPPQPSDAEESPAQRQARLRRERRQAKIAAEGSSRLAKITGIAGRRGPPPASDASSSARDDDRPPQASPAEAEDPDEGDVRHLPPMTQRAGRPRPQNVERQPSTGGFDAGPAADDPMRLMIEQLLGGPGTSGDGTASPAGGGGGGGAPQFPPGMLPPALERILSAVPNAQPGAPGAGLFGGQQVEQPRSVSAASWRVLHAAASLLLALYVTLTFEGGFVGTKAARVATDGDAWVARGDIGRRLFVWFATVEVVLQSARFFLERGQLQKSGLLGTLAAFVPEPFAGYLRIVGRYNVIFSTLLQDALVIIFVLGLMVWWNGFSAAVESR
jgi:hypothetical protein